MRHGFHRPPPEGGRGGKEGGPRRRERTLAEISVTVWLTPENASFQMKNGLLYATVDEKEQRVTLCRQFPMDMPWEYVSVLNEEEHEIGIVRSLSLFADGAEELLRAELERRYYARRIRAIHSVKERYGFSYWRVTSDEGELRFTLQDTFRSITTVNGNRVFFTDIHGNRYEVEDLQSMDAKSRRKLELYV